VTALRRLVATSFGVAALLIAAASAQATTLSLAVADGPVSLPVYVAQARGFFAAEGLDLRVQDCRSGRECYGLLADGRADLATASELLVALGSTTRPDIAIVATISASPYQIKIVARRSARGTEAPQLHGKRVGTVLGSSAQYFLDSWLLFNDIDPASITIVGLEPDQVVAALDQRRVDAIAIWEPLAATAAQTLGGDAVTFANPRVYTQYFNLLAGRPLIARRAPDLARVLRALMRAQRYIAAEPVAARAVLAERLRLPAALAAGLLESLDFRVRLDQSLVATMQSEARWAVHAGVTPKGSLLGVDLLRTIDPLPLQRLDAAAVGLVK